MFLPFPISWPILDDNMQISVFPANFTHFWVTATLKMQLPQIKSFKKRGWVLWLLKKLSCSWTRYPERRVLVQWQEFDPGPMDVASSYFSLLTLVILLHAISIPKAVVHCSCLQRLWDFIWPKKELKCPHLHVYIKKVEVKECISFWCSLTLRE